MKFGKDKIDVKGLEVLEKMLREENIKIKIGILGKDRIRDSLDGEPTDSGGDPIDNVEIGLIHEFGTEHTPERSWLRMPLIEEFPNRLEKSGKFNKKTINQAMKEKSFLKIFTKIAILAVETVMEAFDTGGFGKWKPSDFTIKKNAQTLVETQQLSESVSYEVK